MDLDLVILLIPLAGALLGAVVIAAAMFWARAVDSALADPAPARGSDTADNPTVLFQPPEDAPPA